MVDCKEIYVLLVDDEVCFRQGLRTLLDFYNTQTSLAINIVGEANCVDKLVKLTVDKSPDLILLDLELAIGDGITGLVLLKEISYQGKVLILSGSSRGRLDFSGYAGWSIWLCVQKSDCNTIMRSNKYCDE